MIQRSESNETSLIPHMSSTALSHVLPKVFVGSIVWLYAQFKPGYRPFSEDGSSAPSERSTVLPSEQLYVAYVLSTFTRSSTISSSAHCTGRNTISVKTLSIYHCLNHTAQFRKPVCTRYATSSLLLSVVAVLAKNI